MHTLGIVLSIIELKIADSSMSEIKTTHTQFLMTDRSNYQI